MDILKYSYLHSNQQLVKVLNLGKYGIYDIVENRIIVEPAFDYIEYESDDVLIAKKDGFYFKIDSVGNRLDDEVISEADWLYIEKADICPYCEGNGAACCLGFGIVPIKGDWEAYMGDDF